MGHGSDKFGRRKAPSFVVGVGLIFLIGGSLAKAQVTASVRAPGSDPATRVLNAEEGRLIADAAEDQSERMGPPRDCSHVVHQIYLNAGFEYPYASSFEIYAGDENFQRVKFPQAGDLIVWPGHLGIVVDPAEHSFLSLVSTGLKAQDYEAPYWKSRGRPRFYRYRIGGLAVLSASSTPTVGKVSNATKPLGEQPVLTERVSSEGSASTRDPKAVSERTPMLYGPPAPAAPASPPAAIEIPSSIIIAAGNKSPTRNEVTEGISELSSASGIVLRTNDPLDLHIPVLVVERFTVERVEIKRDRGWAHLQIDSKLSIAGGTGRVKRRREKIRWQLRRTESGWEAVAPSDRTYVPRDVAVKNLAAQLARLTASDGVATSQEAVLRQESRLANLLSSLLVSK